MTETSSVVPIQDIIQPNSIELNSYAESDIPNNILTFLQIAQKFWDDEEFENHEKFISKNIPYINLIIKYIFNNIEILFFNRNKYLNITMYSNNYMILELLVTILEHINFNYQILIPQINYNIDDNKKKMDTLLRILTDLKLLNKKDMASIINNHSFNETTIHLILQMIQNLFYKEPCSSSKHQSYEPHYDMKQRYQKQYNKSLSLYYRKSRGKKQTREKKKKKQTREKKKN